MIRFTDCKINIGLDVVRRRPDGYHDLVTCMVHVPWHDVLEVIPAKTDNTTLTVIGNAISCPPEKNLVMKAYRLLEDKFGLPPVDIILQKIVPDGAGLGGGSSDATNMMRLLSDMFELGLSQADIASMAAGLGADCPFFAYDTPMLCTGIGEIMKPVDIPLAGYTIALVKPASSAVSTKEAYAGINPSYPAESLEMLLQLPIDQWQGKIKNDFETSIFPLCPEIAALKKHLIDNGALYSSMSGSGASVYGIFNNQEMAEKAIFDYRNHPHLVFTV